MNAYVKTRIRKFDITTPLEYIQLMMNYTEWYGKKDNFSFGPTTVFDEPLHDVLLTTEGYYQFLGEENATLAGHQWENMVMKCSVEVFDGFSSSWKRCEGLINVTQITNPRMFNCYTLSIPQKKEGFFISGYSLVLHLDNYESADDFISEYEYSEALGIVVIPHMPGTKAWIEREALQVNGWGPYLYNFFHGVSFCIPWMSISPKN